MFAIYFDTYDFCDAFDSYADACAYLANLDDASDHEIIEVSSDLVRYELDAQLVFAIMEV